MTEYRELHPIGTAERIEALVRANEELSKRLHRLRGRARSLWRLRSLERENKMLRNQFDAMTAAKTRTLASWQAAYDLRRGFRIPDHLQDDYKKLTRSKRIPAREAGRMLGLI